MRKGLCLSMAYRVGEFIPSSTARAETRESTLPLELPLSVETRKLRVSAATGVSSYGCQQRNAVKGVGHESRADQTSMAGQIFRQHHSRKRKLYNQFLELSEASAV